MNFQDIELERCYRSNTPFPPEKFYRTVFPVAKGFRRAAGYFTSTVFNLFNEEIIKFAKNGGKIELICSPFLTEEDIETISKKHPVTFLDTKKILGDESIQMTATAVRMSTGPRAARRTTWTPTGTATARVRARMRRARRHLGT